MTKRFKHTHRIGFFYGAIDFVTAGTFFLFFMPFRLQKEIEEVLGHKVQPYWVAYLLGIPTLFLYTLVWMAKVCAETKAVAVRLGLKPHTSFAHMFWWNVAGMALIVGPAIATQGFFTTLNQIEEALNAREIN